jgi:hypothetical protein
MSILQPLPIYLSEKGLPGLFAASYKAELGDLAPSEAYPKQGLTTFRTRYASDRGPRHRNCNRFRPVLYRIPAWVHTPLGLQKTNEQGVSA